MTLPASSGVSRRTKIIFTLGPATESEEMLEKIILAGADVARLNMAHGSHEWTRTMIRRIRAVGQRVGRDIAIMMDIKGPEIRTGDLAAPIELKPGEIFDFTVRPSVGGEHTEEIRSVDVNYRDLVNDIKIGDTVLVDNGLIRLEVLEKNAARIRCKVLTAGELKSRRHINLPGIKVNLPSFTEKDHADTLVGLAEGIDFIALSFVRTAVDIENLRDFLRAQKSRVKIIAKIEDQSAIAHLDEIVQACLTHGRSVIIATHMLESMIGQPMPTRAEITDVANAVFERSDCVMLSGETTVGLYPLECIQILDKISRRVEADEAETGKSVELAKSVSDKLKVLHSAVVMANEIPGSVLLTFTRQGFMARGLASLRPLHAPILAFAPTIETFRQLHLLRAVEPFLMSFASEPNDTIESAIALLTRSGRIKRGDKIIIATDILAQDRIVDSVQLRTVQ